MRTHQRLDQRTLAMHVLLAEKIRLEPALLARAQQTLSAWRGRVCARSQPYLDDWQGILDSGLEPCLAVMTEQSERATALRQSSPFAGMLSNQERFEFLRSWGRADAQV
jgi:hypothetical protein